MSFVQNPPRKQVRARNINLLIAILVIIVAVTAGAVYALTSLDVTNNVSITPGTAIGVATFTTAPTTCPALGSTTYGTTSPFTNTISWTITAGGSQTQFFCIENQGSGNDPTPTIVLGTTSGFTCTTTPCFTLTTTPATIPALAAQSVSASITVVLSATASTTGTGTVHITIT